MSIAASEGLSAVSMSRVAADLGASTMALYRYLASKDELLVLMMDAIYQTPPSPPETTDEGWRAGLSRWAWEQHTILRKHTWALRIPITGPPVTPNQIIWLERGLQCLSDTPLPEGDKLSVIMLLSGYTRSEATVSADVEATFMAKAPDELAAMVSYGQLVRRLVGPDRFPALNKVIDAGGAGRARGPGRRVRLRPGAHPRRHRCADRRAAAVATPVRRVRAAPRTGRRPSGGGPDDDIRGGRPGGLRRPPPLPRPPPRPAWRDLRVRGRDDNLHGRRGRHLHLRSPGRQPPRPARKAPPPAPAPDDNLHGRSGRLPPFAGPHADTRGGVRRAPPRTTASPADPANPAVRRPARDTRSPRPGNPALRRPGTTASPADPANPAVRRPARDTRSPRPGNPALRRPGRRHLRPTPRTPPFGGPHDDTHNPRPGNPRRPPSAPHRPARRHPQLVQQASAGVSRRSWGGSPAGSPKAPLRFPHVPGLRSTPLARPLFAAPRPAPHGPGPDA
ncbi:hypothetical protein GCM10020295_07730 [Streptomyces cinereospinus]